VTVKENRILKGPKGTLDGVTSRKKLPHKTDPTGDATTEKNGGSPQENQQSHRNLILEPTSGQGGKITCLDKNEKRYRKPANPKNPKKRGEANP